MEALTRSLSLCSSSCCPAPPLLCPQVQVYVSSIGSGLMTKRMHLCKTLWDANISAEMDQAQENPNMKRQLTYALANNIPYMVNGALAAHSQPCSSTLTRCINSLRLSATPTHTPNQHTHCETHTLISLAFPCR
jgi:hypothetical protein